MTIRFSFSGEITSKDGPAGPEVGHVMNGWVDMKEELFGSKKKVGTKNYPDSADGQYSIQDYRLDDATVAALKETTRDAVGSWGQLLNEPPSLSFLLVDGEITLKPSNMTFSIVNYATLQNETHYDGILSRYDLSGTIRYYFSGTIKEKVGSGSLDVGHVMHGWVDMKVELFEPGKKIGSKNYPDSGDGKYSIIDFWLDDATVAGLNTTHDAVGSWGQKLSEPPNLSFLLVDGEITLIPSDMTFSIEDNETHAGETHYSGGMDRYGISAPGAGGKESVSGKS